MKGGDLKGVTIVADDKVGLLADISYILAKSKVNIETITVDVISAKAIISLGLSDSVRGKQVIEAAGYKVEDPEAIVIKIHEKPDELDRIAALLKKEGVSVKKITILTKDSSQGIISLIVDKQKRATAVLKQYLLSTDPGY